MALKLSYYRYTAIEDSFKKIVVTVVTIATSKIAVTLDNHSKKWYNSRREMKKWAKCCTMKPESCWLRATKKHTTPSRSQKYSA